MKVSSSMVGVLRAKFCLPLGIPKKKDKYGRSSKSNPLDVGGQKALMTPKAAPSGGCRCYAK